MGSVLSSGISYIGSFRGSQQPPPHASSGKMMGFGSDSYQGYMGGGGGSSNYAPPGGNQPSSSFALSSGNAGYEKKWGGSPSTQTEYKPMGGAGSSTFEKKTSTTSGVPIVQIKEDKSDEKKHKKKKRK